MQELSSILLCCSGLPRGQCLQALGNGLLSLNAHKQTKRNSLLTERHCLNLFGMDKKARQAQLWIHMQTAWIWMRRRVTRRLAQIQAV